jgi:hypothetical protein
MATISKDRRFPRAAHRPSRCEGIGSSMGACGAFKELVPDPEENFVVVTLN